MISAAAKTERRPISNFITAKVMEEIEMDQINSENLALSNWGL